MFKKLVKNALYGKGQGMYCTCPVFVQNEYNYSKYCSFEYEILKNIERKKNRCYNYCTENFAYEGNCSNTLEIFLQ
ncbi:hypothetical protein RUMOBE_04018 [Blautia obeum ATCC 29174]|uniref:Uncharacterized protein n=1 Tax=Blautia obeum ATCC 29174 TaxID=411459 RepID=A5ZYA9_9FIRM|nr:hypothetical protein RUMOBE_04018 [Blautia obeum ATCC 29174]